MKRTNSKKQKKNKGITLIALVITIIVLLILAGVSIAMLTGDNGILSQAQKAKSETSISTEKEALEIQVIGEEMNRTLGNEVETEIGKTLYSNTLENSNRWNVIVINDTQTVYGDGYKYIEKGTEIENYGEAQYNWLINTDTGEVIQLEEGKYTELSVGDDLAVADGLVFNVDSNNMDNNDLSTWGEGVSLHGFENNTETTSNGLEFDGVDDYVEFKSTADYSKGFTISFYGINDGGGYFFTKQKENNTEYSCRFGLQENRFFFNTSKNRADSKWSDTSAEINNGNLQVPCLYELGQTAYFDLTFDAETNEFKLYKNNELVDSDTVNPNYWSGANGGKQIFEDDTISCYLGRGFGGAEGIWKYGKLTMYSLRLYNRPLNESELKSNYDKTIAAHSIGE